MLRITRQQTYTCPMSTCVPPRGPDCPLHGPAPVGTHAHAPLHTDGFTVTLPLMVKETDSHPDHGTLAIISDKKGGTHPMSKVARSPFLCTTPTVLFLPLAHRPPLQTKTNSAPPGSR